MAAVLTSWKEIAAYLGKGVRTVQRWEREMGLPIRRPKPKEKQIVLAFPDELDDWVRQQSVSARIEAPGQTPTPRITSELLVNSLRISAHRAPLKVANRAGLDRMHLLLTQMIHNAEMVRTRAESLFRNAQQLQNNRKEGPLPLRSARREGSIQ